MNTGSTKKKRCFFVLFFCCLAALDQLIKGNIESFNYYGSLFIIKQEMNHGFFLNSFEFLSAQKIKILASFIASYTFSMLALTKYFLYPHSKLYNYAMLFILAGVFSNLIDRLYLDYVVDYLVFARLEGYAFNLADLYMITGVALIVSLFKNSLFNELLPKLEKRKKVITLPCFQWSMFSKLALFFTFSQTPQVLLLVSVTEEFYLLSTLVILSWLLSFSFIFFLIYQVAGPIYVTSQTLKKIYNNDHLETVRFRQTDELKFLEIDINRIIDKMKSKGTSDVD